MIGAELSPQIATVGLGLGLIFSLICYLTTNLSPGGMITPGWLALILVQDARQMLVIMVMTALTYGLTLVLQKVVILYGKRLFAAIVLLGVMLQLTVYVVIQRDVPLLFTHQTLGFVVPGLIAYQLVRQPRVPTLFATGAASAAAYVVLISGVLGGLLP